MLSGRSNTQYRPEGVTKMPDKVNILMVDDQPGKLLSYEAVLAELGENLIKAKSGKEALDQTGI
jgi:response regulator RpfG family c-di-GMP phosphodiesterase